MPAHNHGVRLRERNQSIAAAEIIGVSPGMDNRKLHLVLSLQLAELGAEGCRIIAVAQVRRIDGGAHFNVVGRGNLTQSRRRSCGGTASTSTSEHASQ